MKKILLLYLVIALAPLIRASWPFTPEQTSAFLARFSAPFKLAQLYADEPDQQLAMPVKAVRVKQVHDTWHASRSGGRLHQGQDIFAPRGTEVYSATEGYVVRIGENSLGGNTVSVLGGGGRVYYYAHLEAYAPKLSVGDAVTTTTVLGYVGTTGNARGTPPHLHFGVYTLSGPVNPLPLLQNRAGVDKATEPRRAKQGGVSAFNGLAGNRSLPNNKIQRRQRPQEAQCGFSFQCAKLTRKAYYSGGNYADCNWPMSKKREQGSCFLRTKARSSGLYRTVGNGVRVSLGQL